MSTKLISSSICYHHQTVAAQLCDVTSSVADLTSQIQDISNDDVEGTQRVLLELIMSVQDLIAVVATINNQFRS